MDPVQQFISRIGSFPIHNVEIQRGIRFSPLERELIQVWYKCYLLKACENAELHQTSYPLRCDGTPEELRRIIHAFQHLGKDERERIYSKYIWDIYNLNWGIHSLIPFQITGRYTDIIDEIMRKIS